MKLYTIIHQETQEYNSDYVTILSIHLDKRRAEAEEEYYKNDSSISSEEIYIYEIELDELDEADRLYDERERLLYQWRLIRDNRELKQKIKELEIEKEKAWQK